VTSQQKRFNFRYFQFEDPKKIPRLARLRKMKKMFQFVTVRTSLGQAVLELRALCTSTQSFKEPATGLHTYINFYVGSSQARFFQ
jgi:hypothetical protein